MVEKKKKQKVEVLVEKADMNKGCHIAVLDKFNVLIGFTTVPRIRKGDVEVPFDCDLDTNEKYRYDEDTKSFIPRGMMVGKPPRCQVPQELAIFLLMKALVRGEPIPQECADYVKWYEENIKKHEDEVKAWRDKK